MELTELEILAKKERWQLYFAVSTEDPSDPSQSIFTILPDGGKPIRMKPESDNIASFVPDGSPGANGMPVVERDMPADNSLNVQVFLLHSRKKGRDVFGEIESQLGGKAGKTLVKTLGVATPWLTVSTLALKEVSKILGKMKDREFGHVNMFEDFNDQDEGLIERSNKFSTGEARIKWRWVVV